MSSENSGYSSYGYSEESNEASGSEEENTVPAASQPNKQRIAFEQETAITLQCGSCGRIEIIPGPDGAFDIKFTVEQQNEPVASIALAIRDGQCRINADNAIVATTGVPAVEPARPEREDPARLYEFRRL